MKIPKGTIKTCGLIKMYFANKIFCAIIFLVAHIPCILHKFCAGVRSSPVYGLRAMG